MACALSVTTDFVTLKLREVNLVVRVDGVRVEVRRGGRRERGRHDGVRHVRRDAPPVARLPPLARVVEHLEVLAAHHGQLLVVVGGARVRDAHHAAAARRHAARPRLAQLLCENRDPISWTASFFTFAWCYGGPSRSGGVVLQSGLLFRAPYIYFNIG